MLGRRFHSPLIQRFAVVALTAAAVVAYSTTGGVAGTSDKQLSRVKGSVGYAADPNGTPKNIFGQQTIADDNYAITGKSSVGKLSLPDSSEIDIGENTTVQIGKFHAVDAKTSEENVIALRGGTIHFIVRHPDGQNANYKFVTPTSQIAVRGTEGLISFINGQTTVTISSGSVVVTTGAVSSVVGSGTSVTASAASGTMSAPAAAPAGAGSGLGAAGGSTSAAASSVGAIAGGAAAVGTAAVVATSQQKGADAPSPTPVASAAPSPSPAPSAAPSPGQIVVNGDTSGGAHTGSHASATLPLALSNTVIQSNCTTPISFTASPTSIATITPATLACVNGAVNGTVLTTYNAYGTVTFSANGSGQSISSTQTLYGAPYVTVAGSSATFGPGSSLSFNGGGSLAITAVQAGGAASINVSLNCSATNAANYSTTDATKAGIGLNSYGNYTAAGTSPFPFTFVIRSAPDYGVAGPPNSSLPAPCTLILAGAGNSTDSTTNIPFNITTTSIGIHAANRYLQTLPRKTK